VSETIVGHDQLGLDTGTALGLHHLTLNLLELCPRGNNKDVIIIILVHDNVYIPC
jgi:hypothetical protein